MEEGKELGEGVGEQRVEERLGRKEHVADRETHHSRVFPSCGSLALPHGSKH